MSIMLVCPTKDPNPWMDAIHKIAPEIPVVVWPDVRINHEVTFALVWQHEHGVFADYANCKVICSMGAGVDHILADNQLSHNIQIVRLVDSKLASMMAEYVISVLEGYRHHLFYYQEQQKISAWSPKSTISKKSLPIGIMGLGSIGAFVAKMLVSLGYKVSGWSRSPKDITGVVCYSHMTKDKNDNPLFSFLNETRILINLLPLTQKTNGILCKENLLQLQPSGIVINLGRGEHVIEEDLIELLNTGVLEQAFLDVFRDEPLNKKHSFWKHSKIMLTPHVSSLTDPDSVALQVVENYRRHLKGEKLINLIDIQRGY